MLFVAEAKKQSAEPTAPTNPRAAAEVPVEKANKEKRSVHAWAEGS